MDALRRIVADRIHSVVDESSIRAKTTLVVPMALPEIVQADGPLLAANFPRRFAGVAYLV
jgi:hypothetical protein